MANLLGDFSDNEANEKVDAILGQRKRKGALEYLVRWKGDGDKNESWESATTIGSDYAKAIQNFLESRKSEKKRSTSRSRKVSRSRSRSSSRNRKSSAEKPKSRSRSRGRPRKSDSVSTTQGPSEEVDGIITPNIPSKNTRSRKSIVITNSLSDENIKAAAEPTLESSTNSVELKSDTESNNMAAPSSSSSKQQLEVQRTHNEHCLVRDDDKKPRSLIWRVADYAVILLFIVSLIAAIFLFLEKIIDLEEFKSQAFPNMQTLKTRLADGVKSISDSALNLLERIGDFWLYLTQQPQKSSA